MITTIDIIQSVIILVICVLGYIFYRREAKKIKDEATTRMDAMNYLSKELLLLDKKYLKCLKNHKKSVKQYVRHKVKTPQQMKKQEVKKQ